MQLFISANRDLPLTTARLLDKRQQTFIPMPQPDTFQNYQFDNRFWSTPVMDIALQKGFSFSNYNKENEHTSNSTAYQADFGMLLGGFDFYGSVFGDNTIHHYGPRARLTIGRTFLEEPKNPLNLTTFEAGDVTGFNSTLFNPSVSGLGAYASSFKDLVLSADKTIDINGPLSEGWQVELYQNNQLIGFRQSPIAGRYQFANVPVSYGLNVFKLVFYGPYGEILTEERNYYSGTSPVKTGAFGYVLNAYQKGRYLFDKNEPYVNPSTKATLDFVGYYGLTDRVTLIAGTSRTPDEVTNEERDYATAGIQVVWSGASIQYNTLYGFKNDSVGHHADIQGNIGIGDIFARYDYYGRLRTPVSYYNGAYLKEMAEGRLTGFMPLGDVPYYVSYLRGLYIDDDKEIQELHTRLSPNFGRYYNLSLENVWHKDEDGYYDDLILLFQAQFNQLGIHSQARYRISPSGYLANLNQQVDYRWTQYTYVQANWDHDCRSNYSSNHDLDTFSLSAARLFDFGGLTLTFSMDTDRNAAVSLTYNLSFGKVPDKMRAFTNAQNKMSQRAALYAKVMDESGHPIPNVKINVTGQQKPVVSDEDGAVLVADMEPYAKTILNIDVDSLNDVSLVPDEEEKKLVLRPGTVFPVQFTMSHKGGFEGWIKTPDMPQTYQLTLYDAKGNEMGAKYPEADGSFIFDSLSYGSYRLDIAQKGVVVASEKIVLNKAFETYEKPFVVSN